MIIFDIIRPNKNIQMIAYISWKILSNNRS